LNAMDLPMPIKYTVKPIVELFESAKIQEQLTGLQLDGVTLKKNLEEAYGQYCEVLRKNDPTINCIPSAKPEVGPLKYSALIKDSFIPHMKLGAQNIGLFCGKDEALNTIRLRKFNQNREIIYRCIRSKYITNTCKITTQKKEGDQAKPDPFECAAKQVMRQLSFKRLWENGVYVLSSEFECCNAIVDEAASVIQNLKNPNDTDSQLSALASQLTDLVLSLNEKQAISKLNITTIDFLIETPSISATALTISEAKQ